jgi:4-amino-4-deoxy-L-arabinose transferase-like glycosyltransferase
MGKNDKVISRLDWVLSGLVFGLSILLYTRTLVTTLLFGDGGEFQVLGYTLGLGHPTGYPVYLLLLKPFTWLPIRDIAYRINLSSAVFGSLTLASVYLCSSILLGSRRGFSTRLASLAGAVGLALTPLFWWHSVMAEVYTPATFFITLVLLLSILWIRSRNNWLLFWAGVAGGASLGVHGMVPLIAPAVVIFILISVIQKTNSKLSLVTAFCGGILGLIFWIGAFWALDLNNPPSNNLLVSARYNLDVWQINPEEYDRSFLTRFKYLASGQMFQEIMNQTRPDLVKAQWTRYQDETVGFFSILFLGFSGIGLLALFLTQTENKWQEVCGWKSLRTLQWKEGLLLILAWAGLMYFVLTYQIGDYWAFYIPTYPVLAIFAGVGAGFSVSLILQLLNIVRVLRGKGSQLAGILVGMLILFGVVHPYSSDLGKSWRMEKISFLTREEFRWYPFPVHDPNAAHRYAAQVINKVEDNAIVITTWDLVYPILYVAHIEQRRLGISAFETYRSLLDINPSDMTLNFIRENLAKRPIYVTRTYSNMKGFRLTKINGVELYRVSQR